MFWIARVRLALREVARVRQGFGRDRASVADYGSRLANCRVDAFATHATSLRSHARSVRDIRPQVPLKLSGCSRERGCRINEFSLDKTRCSVDTSRALRTAVGQQRAKSLEHENLTPASCSSCRSWLAGPGSTYAALLSASRLRNSSSMGSNWRWSGPPSQSTTQSTTWREIFS